jgi:hypothetical protein
MKMTSINFDPVKLATAILAIVGYETGEINGYTTILVLLLLIEFKFSWKQ